MSDLWPNISIPWGSKPRPAETPAESVLAQLKKMKPHGIYLTANEEEKRILMLVMRQPKPHIGWSGFGRMWVCWSPGPYPRVGLGGSPGAAYLDWMKKVSA